MQKCHKPCREQQSEPAPPSVSVKQIPRFSRTLMLAPRFMRLPAHGGDMQYVWLHGGGCKSSCNMFLRVSRPSLGFRASGGCGAAIH